MTTPNEQADAHRLSLNLGQPVFQPGPDLYLYTIKCPGHCQFQIGSRGIFMSESGSFPARLVDRRDSKLTFCLKSGRKPAAFLVGAFHPFDSTAVNEPDPAIVQPLPQGTAAFLDHHDGWLVRSTEAAGGRESLSGKQPWPAISRNDLPCALLSSGINFIWSQRTDGKSARHIAEHLIKQEGQSLALGEPRDLEALATLPGVVFNGPALPGSPLAAISIHTLARKAALDLEAEQGRLRENLAALKSEEAAIKAKVTQWEDLEELELKFSAMAERSEQLRLKRKSAEKHLAEKEESWERAELNIGQKGRGILGLFRRPDPETAALATLEASRAELALAEESLGQLRRNEEELADEAAALKSRLEDSRLSSLDWDSRQSLESRLESMRKKAGEAAGLLAAALDRPEPKPEDMLAGAALALALTADMLPGEALDGQRFDHVLVIAGPFPDHQERRNLACMITAARQSYAIIGDFTLWPLWDGDAPVLSQNDEARGWNSFRISEDTCPAMSYMAEGGPFQSNFTPPPEGLPVLSRLELGQPSPKAVSFDYIVPPVADAGGSQSINGPLDFNPQKQRRKRKQASLMNTGTPCGLGLRAFGDLGPANPVSALLVAKAALNFAADIPESEVKALIITASRAQADLINGMLLDLKAEDKGVLAGEAQDFANFSSVPLVILEPAFEMPHQSHPWAWPSFGRRRLSLAWRLAQKHIWLAGRDDWMKNLPDRAPLALLWRRAAEQAKASFNIAASERIPHFWEALDKAKNEVWAIVPAFETFWWKALEEHFLAAARRKVRINLICARPETDSQREYAASVVRLLSTYGCSVHISSGLPGFIAVVDEEHFSWGSFQPARQASQVWGGLCSAIMPGSSKILSRIMQIDLIRRNMSRPGGGIKNCRNCGWPLILLNQAQLRGLSDEQPLKLDCLANCWGNKSARRLDDGEPPLSVPKCGVDHTTSYELVQKGRHSFWACPKHPDDPRCPSVKAAPGDNKKNMAD